MRNMARHNYALRVFQALCTLLMVLCATLIVYGQTLNPELDIRPLPLNASLERSIKSGDNHFYSLEMKSGELLRLEVREKSTNLGAGLSRVADKKLLAVSISPFDRVTLSYIAEKAGLHTIIVVADKYTTSNASYKLTASLTFATSQDRERIKAETLAVENAHGGDDSESIRRAIHQLEESFKYWSRVNDPYWEPLVLYSLGRLNYKMGELGKALDQFNQACLLFRQAGDLDGEAWSRNYLGIVHYALGAHENADQELTQANRLFVQLVNPFGAVAAANNIGLVFINTGRPERALTLYDEQVLPVLRKFGDVQAEGTALNNIAKLYGELGNPKKQLEYSQQALQLFRRIGDHINEAVMVNNIGGAYEQLGRHQEAYETYRQALLLLNAAGDKLHDAGVFVNLLHICRLLQKPRLAIFYGKQAVNRYQEARGAVTSLDKELQQTYAKSVDRVYRELSELLIEQGQQAEALQLLNSFKDQQFFDFNPSSRKELAPVALTPREGFFSDLYKEKSAQGARFASWRSGLRNIKPNAEHVDAERKLVNDQFLAFFNQVEQEFSQQPTDRDVVGEIKDLHELQAVLEVLNQSTGQLPVAIYTLIGKERYSALIITPQQIFDVSKPIKDSVLNRRALEFWALLRQDTYDPRVLARELYELVFAPIAPKLPPGTKVLLWSLDGNLRYIPMAALYDGKQYLVERYQNVVFTRADRERMTRAVSPRWTGVGFGNTEAQEVKLLGESISFTTLPGVKTELKAIFGAEDKRGAIIEGDVWQNEQFNRTAIIAALKQRRPLVHIASHFSFKPGDEARSFLLLGDGTPFTLAEMKDHVELFAGVELLTLSACNTAAQQAGANGREIDGFAELAQRLGAAAVMATLWSVEDDSTPWLMRDFYQGRQSSKQFTKTAALQQAQLGLLQGKAAAKPLRKTAQDEHKVKIMRVPGGRKLSKRLRADIIYMEPADAPLYRHDRRKPFAHPHYWAPFILIGNLR